MLPTISLSKRLTVSENIVFLINSVNDIPRDLILGPEITYLRNKLKDKKKDVISLNRLGKWFFVVRAEKRKSTPKKLEKFRKTGDSLLGVINDNKIVSVSIFDLTGKAAETLAMAEGMALGNYKFLKYVKDAADKEPSLKTIEIVSKQVKSEAVDRLNLVCEAVYRCRSLVNEPLSSLNAEKLAQEFVDMGTESGIKVEVLIKSRIEALRMGGLLAVNRGSIDPPTFTIIEYKPDKPVNKKPIVFIGKGVVYDTGGLSLKPTASMDTMKSDMAGAAAVASAIYAIAKAKLPLHVISLIPATDNRPDGNATVPGDIITMMDGTTVEVMNTDAEGRLILADALTYAKNYDPMLVIDLATLTGAAVAALGTAGTAGMHVKAGKYFDLLCETGTRVHERIAEFPMWDDYGDLIKSDIADLKNVGGRYAGTITAAKFLQHFTDYPWIHLDIAGPSFLDKKDSYRTAGGTATGVRLLFDLALRMTEKP
jgi:leucyl aminopeptidase